MRVPGLIVLVIATLVPGCTGSGSISASPIHGGVKRLDTTVEYVGPDNVKLQSAHFSKDIVLAFPNISGAIFGAPATSPVYIVKVDEKLHFSLNLQENLPEIKSGAAPLSDEWKLLGLSVKPENTRLARLGTFPFDAVTRKPLGGGGFIDPVSRNTLILVYVDRPCEIKGSINFDNELYVHDLRFITGGFHWIKVTTLSPNKFRLERHPDDSDVHFSIHVENIISI